MQVLAALADPTRRRIVEMLAEGSLCSGQIASRFDISAPAVSQHLKVLRGARLVRARVEAQRRIYELDREGVDELSGWLARIQQFWNPKLDRLEQLLKQEPP
jgi:DNA-binding transcriptional ArsR family regulator